MNNWSPDIYNSAWNFASIHHSGQSYGGSRPNIRIDYINHIGSVAMELIWALPAVPDCDANLAIQSALLHDTIEDTDVTYDDIVSGFGQNVADGVLALSKNTQIANKEEQIKDSIKRIKKQPKEIWMVKMADRICNLYHPPYYWDTEKKAGYRNEARFILNDLCQANKILADRLSTKIDIYKEFI